MRIGTQVSIHVEAVHQTRVDLHQLAVAFKGLQTPQLMPDTNMADEVAQFARRRTCCASRVCGGTHSGY